MIPLFPFFVVNLVPAFLGVPLRVYVVGTFIGIVSLVLTMAGRFYPTRPAKMMGKMTISYGIAQIVTPAITGLLAEGDGTYNSGLYLAVGTMILGTMLMLLLRAHNQK